MYTFHDLFHLILSLGMPVTFNIRPNIYPGVTYLDLIQGL